MRKFASTLAAILVVAVLVAASSAAMAQRGQGGPGRGLGPGKGIGGGLPGSPGCINAGPGAGFQAPGQGQGFGQGRFCPRYDNAVRPQMQTPNAPGCGMVQGNGRSYGYRYSR